MDSKPGLHCQASDMDDRLTENWSLTALAAIVTAARAAAVAAAIALVLPFAIPITRLVSSLLTLCASSSIIHGLTIFQPTSVTSAVTITRCTPQAAMVLTLHGPQKTMGRGVFFILGSRRGCTAIGKYNRKTTEEDNSKKDGLNELHGYKIKMTRGAKVTVILEEDGKDKMSHFAGQTLLSKIGRFPTCWLVFEIEFCETRRTKDTSLSSNSTRSCGS